MLGSYGKMVHSCAGMFLYWDVTQVSDKLGGGQRWDREMVHRVGTRTHRDGPHTGWSMRWDAGTSAATVYTGMVKRHAGWTPRTVWGRYTGVLRLSPGMLYRHWEVYMDGTQRWPLGQFTRMVHC